MSDSDDDEPPLLVNLEVEANDSISTNPTTTTTTTATSATNTVVTTSTSSEPLPPCPVTILSGFLGSGKTTLIQYILKSPDHKKRIAVIENEFGEGLAIESLIARDGMDPDQSNNLADLIELPNGCVCCTVKDSLVATLENLLTKRQDLDYILIEASGMANPGPIASVFWLDDELESRLQLDGVVTLVDSYNILSQLKETTEASQQIAYADRILLNKTDLVESTREIQATIRAINPTAHIQSTAYSKVPDLNWILDAKCYDKQHQKTQEIKSQVEDLVSTLEDGHNHDHSHSHSHEHDDGDDDSPSPCLQCQQHHSQNGNSQETHTHTGAVSTIALKEPGTMDWSKLNSWLASTLWPNQDEKDKVLRSRLEKQLEEELATSTGGGKSNSNSSTDAEEAPSKTSLTTTTTTTEDSSNPQQQIFRMKGIISVKHNPATIEDEKWLSFCDADSGIDRRQFIVQGVYDLWEVYPTSSEQYTGTEERVNKLVVIGRHLQREELQQGFHSCLI